MKKNFKPGALIWCATSYGDVTRAKVSEVRQAFCGKTIIRFPASDDALQNWLCSNDRLFECRKDAVRSAIQQLQAKINDNKDAIAEIEGKNKKFETKIKQLQQGLA